MYKLVNRFRNFFLGTLLVGLATGPSAAQSQVQARSYQDNRTFRTASPELAVDAQPFTSATVAPVLLGPAALRVTFPVPVQPGQQGIVIIKASTALATVLGGMSLQTFSTTAQNPDSPIQSIALDNSSLIQVTVDSNNPSAQQVRFTATQAFDQLELAAGTLLNTNYSVDVYSVFASVAPLPVQLTVFQGKATETGVALHWETASEHNADYFEVQRAESLPEDFRPLGRVQSAGNSPQQHTYQLVDAAAVGLCYYRLRQVDLGGAETFSSVVAVAAGPQASLIAYPTLATHTLHVAGLANLHLLIFNQQGQQMQTANLTATQRQLDVSNLPGGAYFLRDAATGQTTRFVKVSGER